MKSIVNKFSNIQIGNDIKIKIQLNIKDETVKNDDNEFSNIQISQIEDNEFGNSNSEVINSNESKIAKKLILMNLSKRPSNYICRVESQLSLIPNLETKFLFLELLLAISELDIN